MEKKKKIFSLWHTLCMYNDIFSSVLYLKYVIVFAQLAIVKYF